MPIDDWMPTLKTKLAEITSLTQVHSYNELPASLQAFPCAIITTRRGNFEYGLGSPAIAEHDVDIAIYTSDQILAEAHNVATGFIELVRDKLAASMQLGAAVVIIMPAPDGPTYEGPGQLLYADKRHTGVVFHYRVTENETGKFTVSI